MLQRQSSIPVHGFGPFASLLHSIAQQVEITMRTIAFILIVVAALGATVSNAQSAAKTTAPVTVTAVEPGLYAVAGARVQQVAAAGVQKITAMPGKDRRSIAVESPWGYSYFDYPKNVKPVPFEIWVGGSAGGATISAPGFNDTNKADYKAAIDAIISHAIKSTQQNRIYMQGSGR